MAALARTSWLVAAAMITSTVVAQATSSTEARATTSMKWFWQRPFGWWQRHDRLNGGKGKDTYVLQRGRGYDIIEYFSNADQINVLGYNDNKVRSVRRNGDVYLYAGSKTCSPSSKMAMDELSGSSSPLN